MILGLPKLYKFGLILGSLLFCSCSSDMGTKAVHSSIPTKAKAAKAKKVKAPIRLPLTRKTAVAYLKEYGKKNTENRIKITTPKGDIVIKLYKDTPLHRANFVFLVKHKYFDVSYFHRVVKGFIIQGGNSDEMQTVNRRHELGDYRIPAEFRENHPHRRGVIAAARKWDKELNPDKMSTPYEFYIIQGDNDNSHLNSEHTVFGEVIEGMSVVDKINLVQVDRKEWPDINVTMKMTAYHEN